jgi:cytochrome P450
MTDFDSVDYFTDPALIPDPYPYFDHLRAQCPVLPQAGPGVVTITGHEEALEAYRDPAMSSCVSVVGPLSGVSFESDGDDITELIEQKRDQIPMSEHVVTMDPPEHTRIRGLLSRLLTPKRLKENEAFVTQLADRQLDEFLARGTCEFMEDYAKPFSMLVIADLLGVPEEDHRVFRAVLAGQTVGGLDEQLAHNPLEFLNDRFSEYIVDRRNSPRGDVLTELAKATYPDGATPEVDEVVRVATFMFAAGQETTTKLLSAGMRVLGERPDIQATLRENRALIPTFLEESLRLESPVKSHFRLARTTTTVGGVEVPAGTTIMLLPGASNRDPRKFDNPDEFRADRHNVREHVAFGRGIHTCPGAPLARTEGLISMNRILDRMADIAIDETVHGPAGQRTYTYDPTFVLRGLSNLHLTFTPVAADQVLAPGA